MIELSRDNELCAVHVSGRKLYAPLWDSEGEIIPSALPLAAVSIDQDGKTFPEGSFWLRNSFNRLQAGWSWAGVYRDGELPKKRRPQVHAKQRAETTTASAAERTAPPKMESPIAQPRLLQ
jgi:hypothetical protein